MRGVLKTKTHHYRPNRLARGMTETWERSKRSQGTHPNFRSKLSDDALSLVVKGTTDKTGAGFQFRIKRVKGELCHCCGQPKPRLARLNDSGKLYYRRRLNTRLKPKLLRPSPRPLAWIVTVEVLACDHLYVDGQQDGERGVWCLYCNEPKL